MSVQIASLVALRGLLVSSVGIIDSIVAGTQFANAEDNATKIAAIITGNTGGNKGGQAEAPVETAAKVDTAVATETAAPAPVKTKADVVVDALNHEKHTLRSVTAIDKALNEAGFTGEYDDDDISEILVDAEVEFLTKTRRGDREVLFGLTSRN